MRNEPCFVGTSVTVGIFRCRPDDPAFEDSGPAEHHCFVFPRTSVWIQHAGQAAFVADPHVVTFYNPGQEYRRRVLDGRGDACEWFAVHPDVLREMTSAIDRAAADREACGFDHSHCLSDAWSYVEQRRVFRHVTNEAPDPLLVEETALRILWRLLSGARNLPPLPVARGAVALSEAVKGLLARSFADRLTLGQLARALDTSVFHLCRAFRAATGTTIHAYLSQVRLRASLEPLLDGTTPLTEIALAHGYSSHSHYSSAFRAAVGMTPSDARQARHAPSIMVP